VTIQVLDAAGLAVGTKKVFHTTSLIYGKTLGLKELRETPVTPRDNAQTDSTADLMNRVKTADMVVTAKIVRSTRAKRLTCAPR
jgi:hypothetical protein